MPEHDRDARPDPGIGRTVFAVWAFRGHRPHMHFVNALVWEIGTAPTVALVEEVGGWATSET